LSNDRLHQTQPDPLPAIELLCVRDPIDWLQMHCARAARTLKITTRGVPRSALFAGDNLAHLWLRATNNPWRSVIRALVFLCSDLELTAELRDDHAAYLDHWLKVLNADKCAIFTAAFTDQLPRKAFIAARYANSFGT
jgi:hypothetical protein